MTYYHKTRLFVEKKAGFQVEANALLHELNHNLHLNLTSLRLINVYDIFEIDAQLLEKAKQNIFSEPVTDLVFDQLDTNTLTHFAIEFLPGQFDQRADSAMQCLSLIDPKNNSIIKSAKLIVVDSSVSSKDLEKIKKYCINEVEAREKDLSILDATEKIDIAPIPIFKGFINFSIEEITSFKDQLSLAMSLEDILFVQEYFKNEEKRDPYETEIKVLDTYWSDHCRHTTFETELENITFNSSEFEPQLQNALTQYLALRDKVHGSKKPITLMDMATICGKNERKSGNLDDMEISDEINACSVFVDVDVDGQIEKWLLMFKNETHNHPTEIEPYGGASTCVGGAIRDPLSGRSYVYQAMRVTGAGNITEPVENTIEGKLPQRVISKSAAHGYSSYGNQIGLACTHVREIFHEGYKAKRMEIGAVVGAVPANQVRREKPLPGDVIIMFGGRTGRDGIGGATGSSKEHTETSLEVCAAEVQKGNAPEERKIQHLFRNPEVTKLIKKSNDFGAGGVSVAIGELADGLEIDPKDVDRFFAFCHQENIEATIIAHVTDENRLKIKWNGETIVNISRDFINTSGVRQKATVTVDNIPNNLLQPLPIKGNGFEEQVYQRLSDLNVASQKGMIEMFDATIGASTVLMPFGGKYQLTETQAGVQKFPVRNGITDTASILSYGYNPFISERSPFHGAQIAILESMAKIVAVGGNYEKIRFTFQEYFEKLGKEPTRWGKPFAALLGAVYMQNQFHLPAIGGKDSMSGTFKHLNVPPTLVSFAITTEKASKIISPEFKKVGNNIYLLKCNIDRLAQIDIEQTKALFEYVYRNIQNKKIISCFTLQFGGVIEALAKMGFGNDLGCTISTNEDLFKYGYGSFIVETEETLDFPDAVLLGTVTEEFIVNGIHLSKKRCLGAWRSTFDQLYPETVPAINQEAIFTNKGYMGEKTYAPIPKPVENVKVVLPVFPGTNCDYDTARAFEQAGAETTIFVFKNLDEESINESIEELTQLIDNSHILALSGGFSSGDEPDGSGKFIANVLNNEKIKGAIERLLAKKYLIVGICNGFQALVKSGLLPDAKIGEVTPNSPTLYRNDINRHLSHITKTVVSSNNSPWLSSFKVGEMHHVAISHGEGKFVVSEELAKKLFTNGQVAFQYCDFEGNPTMEDPHNPNGSQYAIEGMVSSCGLILGKMGHSERKGDNLYKNITGNKVQNIFTNAIKYLKNDE